MSIPITCPSCSKSGKVPDLAMGKTIRCPACGHQFVVSPSPRPEVAAPMSAMQPMTPMEPMPGMMPMAPMSRMPDMTPMGPLSEALEEMRTQALLPEPEVEILPEPPVPVAPVPIPPVPVAPAAEMLDFDDPIPAPVATPEHIPPVAEDDPFAFDYSPKVAPAPSKVPPAPSKTKPAPEPVADNPDGFDGFGESLMGDADGMDLLEFEAPAPKPIAPAPAPAPMAESMDFDDAPPVPAPARRSTAKPTTKPEPVAEEEMDFDEPEPASGNPFAVKASAFGKIPDGRRKPVGGNDAPRNKWLLPAEIGACAILLLVIIGLAVALSGGSPTTTQSPIKTVKTTRSTQK